MRRKAKFHRPLSHNGSGASASNANTTDENDDSELAVGHIRGEPLKTLLAGLFLVFAWVATTTSLALTHERLPNVTSLPDLTLDNIKKQPWGLDASEIILMICTWMAFLVAIFHKHRFIVLRRIFFLVGIHYYYRAITMYVTVLPKPDQDYVCEPKLNHTTSMDIFLRVVKLLSGMGLSINGKHVYCGDYIYSGHTMTLIMTYLVIKECKYFSKIFRQMMLSQKKSCKIAPDIFHIFFSNFRFAQKMVSIPLVILGAYHLRRLLSTFGSRPLFHRRYHRLLDHHQALVDLSHIDQARNATSQ